MRHAIVRFSRIVPGWLRSAAILVAVWIAVMAAVALTPAAAFWHEMDMRWYEREASSQSPNIDPRLLVIDVAIDTSGTSSATARNRCTLAAFFDQLRAHNQHPSSVVLDFELDPVAIEPSCAGRTKSATLPVAIERATSDGIKVYAVDQPQVDLNGDINGPLDAIDPNVANVVTLGHTRWSFHESGASFYRSCYPASGSGQGNGWSTRGDLWAIPLLASQASTTSCMPRAIAVVLGPSLVHDAGVFATISAAKPFPSNTSLNDRYVVLGTVAYDRAINQLPKAQQDACGSDASPICNESGPEIVAWGISSALQAEQVSAAQTHIGVLPLNGLLRVSAPAFAAIVVLGFAASFFVLRRLRLKVLRPLLSWFSALAGLAIGCAAFVVFLNGMFAASHAIQPQVTLISLGMILAAGLCLVRGNQLMFDEQHRIDATYDIEEYDYDVFISYAHDELAWVLEHVYAPLQAARLPDDRKLKLFFDSSSIRGGSDWQSKISLSIDHSRFVVPVYSATYFQKPYCRFEINRAHLKWIHAGMESNCVLPVIRGSAKELADSRAFQAVADIQAISIVERPAIVEEIIAQIVERLARESDATADQCDS